VQANWGHILDGNLHFNVAIPGKFEKDDAVLQRLEPALFEAVIRRGGSISAEHGLGQSKNQYLDKIHDPAKLETMRSIKQLFDPHGILNPHKYLPDET
jgi:FAD/FMN-containing dehydrogenase